MKDYTARTAQESRHGVLDLVRRHRALVQPVVRAHGGRIVKTIGDALLIAFDSATGADRKSTRLNSSHANISYAVFCLKKTKKYDTLESVVPLPLYTPALTALILSRFYRFNAPHIHRSFS